jgi:2-oxoisovalerate dehydrogenase E1 component
MSLGHCKAADAELGASEPFARDASGRVVLPNEPRALYAFASLLRAYESLLLDLFRRNLLSGTTHTCLGQELCQMAVVRALAGERDLVFSSHRNHGHLLTYSGEFVGLLAEIMGRSDGLCGGRGGSQHLLWRGFHSSGVQAGLTAIAIGHALERKRKRESGLAVVFVGDGTLGEGLLYESFNLAAVWDLPVLFVIENNGVAQSTPTAPMLGGGSIVARSEAFGLPTWRFDDAAVDFVDQVERAVGDVRGSYGPGCLVIDTRRLGPHSTGDDFRAVDQLRAIEARDPIGRLAERLTPSERRQIDEANESYLEAVHQRASASRAARFQTPQRHLYPVCTDARPLVSGTPAAARSCRSSGITYRASLNAAIRHLLATDPRTFLLGEDLADPYGGAFKVTAGLSTAFGDRVLSTPVSEAAIVGTAIGAAMSGGRPLVEIMFSDFLTLAADQIVNHAVKVPGLDPAKAVPLLIRTASGGGRGYGSTHSQSLEPWFAAIPGVTVIAPSHRHDPGELLRRAVCEWPSTTMFFEHKQLYSMVCDRNGYEELPVSEVDPGAHLFPTLVSGPERSDVTLVTYGGMAPVVEAAAERLRREELTVRVMILALLAPLPTLSLRAALAAGAGTSIVVVEEAHARGGIGAEIGSLLAESGYSGRFARVTTPPVPIPAARSLEADLLPNEAGIVDQVAALILEPNPGWQTVDAYAVARASHQ